MLCETEFLQEFRQLFLLCLGQDRSDLRNELGVFNEHFVEQFFSFGRQLRTDCTTVFRARDAFDEAFAFKIIDDTRDVAPSDEAFLRKLPKRKGT